MVGTMETLAVTASPAEATEQDHDLAILERVAAGDIESFALLVERHQEKLVRLCERFLGGRDDARDATQEVFLKAFKKAASYRPRGQVYTWLYRIAVNHCLNQLRRRRVVRFFSFAEVRARSNDPETTPRPLDPLSAEPDVERRLQARQDWQATRRRIDRLPPGQQAVLVLTKLEGLSYRQAAEALGISEGAVESRLFRAMRTLIRMQETEP